MRPRQMAFAALFSLTLAIAKKKNPDDATQTLELPKDPPMVAIGETSRLAFHVSPLSAKGLLSQQTRDALKAISKANGGAPVIHIRAFVAGSGDLRRIPQLVSAFFTERKMPLPSISVIQAGGLPMVGAQIVLETVSAGKKEVNPQGLTFVGAKTAVSLEKSLDELAAALGGAVPLQVSCFVSDASSDSAAIAKRFPSAAVDVVQPQRNPVRSDATCEAVAGGAIVRAPRLAFTGTQVAFGSDQKAAALAFQRLDRALAEAGVTTPDIVATNLYPLSGRTGEQARSARNTPGVFTMIPVEGLPSLDASFAVDLVAGVTR